MTKDTTYAYLGTSSWKLVGAGTSVVGLQCQSVSSLGYTGSARVFIGSIYLRGSGGETVNVYTTVRYTDATFVSSTVVQHTLTDAWTRVTTNTLTLNSAKTADYIMVYVETASATSSATYFVDAAQVEEKAYATSYCDGSIGTGYAWSGTAHASSSTRTAMALTVDETARIRPERGGLALRFLRDYDIGSNQVVFNVGTPAANKDGMALNIIGTNDKPRAHWTSNNSSTATNIAEWGSVNTVDTWYFAAHNWDGTSHDITIDNATPLTGSRAAVSGDIVHAGFDMAIGDWNGGTTNHLNGYIGPVLIADRPLTARERALLNARTVWGWSTIKGRKLGRLTPF